ncbi:MAG: DUF4340 domain-containing protein [Chitinophagales bacterium]
MLKKLSNLQLLLLLILLMLIIGGIKWYDHEKGERNFRKELVSIDSSRISALYIYPQFSEEKEVVLYNDKKDQRWEVKINEDFGAPANRKKLSELMLNLHRLKPERVVANSEKFWPQYKVDSSGTKLLVVYENEKRAIELIIGRAEFKNQQDIHSYVRVSGEKNIYEIPSKLAITAKQEKDHYRSKKLISIPKEDWKRLIYKLPAFGDYILEKRENTWNIDNVKIDSSRAEQLLGKMADTRPIAFYDEKQIDDLSNKPDFQLIIESKSGNTDTLKGFVLNDKELLTSSANPVNVIDAGTGKLFENIFIGKGSWQHNRGK